MECNHSHPDVTLNIIDAHDTEGSNVASRPLMVLLKNLIKIKQNLVMTNSQIIQILKKEFDIKVENLHEIEMNAFIRIIKKFLKDWPQWEELEYVTSRLKRLNDYEAIQNILNHKYKNLKEYLGLMLNIAKDTVSSLEDVNSESLEYNEESNDVVIEICCSRGRLNHLIYSKPKITQITQTPTIFNTSQIVQKIIPRHVLSLETILNFWCFEISIKLPWFVYSRNLSFNFEHTLLNKARNSPEHTNDTCPGNWQMKTSNSQKIKQVCRSALITEMKRLIDLYKTLPTDNIVQVVFEVLIDDLEDGPDDFIVSAMYRRYCSKNKYEKYLFSENDDNKDVVFDIQLHEVITPIKTFKIQKFFADNNVGAPVGQWLKIKCELCNIVYSCSDATKIINHYNNHVEIETGWHCSSCKKDFSVGHLAANKWVHDC